MSAPPARPAARPLPPWPSLEYERKEAKALLLRLRAGEPDALAHAEARHRVLDVSAPERIRLADAQLVIAREYGFASWPKLGRYFAAAERERRTPRRPSSMDSRDFFEGSVRGLLVEHKHRRQLAARTLASYVPRLYALPANDVFAETITEDEARLAIARQHGFPSWQVLIERVAAQTPSRDDAWEVDPFARAGRTMKAGDLDALRQVVAAHPEILHPPADERVMGRDLLRMALYHERHGAPVRPIVDWLVTQGFDVQTELNVELRGHMHIRPGTVRWLLDRGADPNWVGPDGSPVLEHALVRYWSGEAVDVLAHRTTPRDALWIAAGLGDIDGVRRFLDRDGKPRANARRIAPPAMQRLALPTHPEPGDEEILLEAFFVAMLNGRTAVMEYIASRGFDPNTLLWDSPVLNMAAGNAWVPVVASLLRCGADPDIKGYRPTQSAREMARFRLVNNDRDPGVREVARLLGMDPDAVLAERDAQAPPPTVDPQLQEALALAADDAFRQGRADVAPENLLFGLLRGGGLPLLYFTKVSRMDVERFHGDVADRVRPADDRVEHPPLALGVDAETMVRDAIDIATARRRDTVLGVHLLYALTRAGTGVAAELLVRYGTSASVLNAELDRGM